MAIFVFSNNFKSTLSANISSTATVITVATTTNIPTIPVGYYWEITLNDAATGNIYEVVYATQYLGGGQLQVLRGQEGTTARAWATSDKVYSCASAGVLASFANAGNLAGFVQLSPASRQTGGIEISGNINTNGAGQFGAGVVANGPITNASTGAFSGGVTLEWVEATQAYGNLAVSGLPIAYEGAGGLVGLGASSGLSAEGVAASVFGIGRYGGTALFAIDTSGDVGLVGGLSVAGSIAAATLSLSGNAVVGGELFANSSSVGESLATTFLQNGTQVLDAITSTGGTISVTGSGATRNVEVLVVPNVAKIYNQNGTLLSSTPKMVLMSVLIPAGTGTTNVTMSGAAVFTGSGTYYVFPSPYQTSLPSSAVSYFFNNDSGSEFTIINGTISSNINLALIAIGY